MTDPGLNVTFPIKIIGDEHEPSHVTVEMSGVLKWAGKGGWIEGVTFRRPRIASGGQGVPEILRLHNGGRLDMAHCVLENEGSPCSVAVISGADSRGHWRSTDIKGSEGGSGVVIDSNGFVELRKVRHHLQGSAQ